MDTIHRPPSSTAPQRLASAPQRQKTASRIIIGALLLIALALLVWLVSRGSGRKKEAQYAERLQTLVLAISDSSTMTHNAAVEVENVWRNAIWETRDEATGPFTMENGSFVDDFNIALDNLYSDPAFSETISAIANDRETIALGIGYMNDPPRGYESAYDALNAYYNVYVQLTGLVLNNGGYTYNTFSDDLGTLDRDSSAAYLAMLTYIKP